MNLKPIKKRKRLYQEVIERIQSLIEEGEIEPGSQLPSERKLAEWLSVSRTTIKEAFSVLEAKGIVTIHQGVGVFLISQSKEWIISQIQLVIQEQKPLLNDLIELRQAIEGDAAYYAAKRINPEQRELLSRAYNDLISALQFNKNAVEEDYEFHLAISKASNNSMLLEVMNVVSQSIKSSLLIHREETIKSAQMNEEVIKEHREIYEAIMEGRAEDAKRAMWNHLKAISVRHK
ncbi:FadR family transcriptional regulator [Bacillus sp. ISL-47]|uniref:FadR/GntR family transcriptional regulator n=1 Tax=Bacillus sp. ISL-47 TaxID=2819130 RepID=UPI001BE6B8E8|nr:FadR/GntR family transcriptional regulator [Bacillus sp. ISL-47]MBT2688068.1 FadR family transcriptional regulator [Bacillus sp. ISL-47]MBT2707922.1 FadR family transcriptional regulator [Pseudomonas sp. ISL-84]